MCFLNNITFEIEIEIDVSFSCAGDSLHQKVESHFT